MVRTLSRVNECKGHTYIFTVLYMLLLSKLNWIGLSDLRAGIMSEHLTQTDWIRLLTASNASSAVSELAAALLCYMTLSLPGFIEEYHRSMTSLDVFDSF